MIENLTKGIMSILRKLYAEDPGHFESELQGFCPDWGEPRIEPAILEYLKKEWTPEIVEWIVKNVWADDVPMDEENTEGLIYNLVQLAQFGRPYKAYDYKPEQDKEIKALYEKYGVE